MKQFRFNKNFSAIDREFKVFDIRNVYIVYRFMLSA
jgi:hypothetical protein